jgi:hypothetical protein
MTKPYCLSDFLRMKPGALILGLSRPESSWKPSPEWEVPESMSGLKLLRISPFLEHRVRWRQHLRNYSRLVKQTRVYRPPAQLIQNSENRVIMTKFEIGSPVGIYLGHIVRINGVSLVNILTSDGYDIWL